MGIVVTVMNMKGGVGKTTLTLNLSGLLARFAIAGRPSLKVLAIDYDPQFNLSQGLLPSKIYFDLEKNYQTTLAVLLDSGTALNAYSLQVPGNHNPPPVASIATRILKDYSGSGLLDLIPSTLNLMYVALGQATTNTAPIEERFEKFIAECKSCYDLIMIDCHPAGSLFTKTSLRNSDFVLIPVMPQKYAVRGIGLMMEFIKAKKAGITSPKPMIVFNATKRTGVSQEEARIRTDARYTSICQPTSLKLYKAFAVPEEGKGFVWQSKAPYSTAAFLNLYAVAREFRAKIGV